MMHARSKQTPKVTPEMLGLLEWLSGSGWILRNEDFVAIWCNEAYAAIGNLKPEDVVGTKLADYIGDDAAKDRERSYSVAIEENRPVTNIQFTGDDRMLSMIFPIDEEAFGHKGVLCMIQEAPRGDNLKLKEIETVVQSPVFVQLAALSTAELRVLYYLARGNSTQQISEKLFRSTKTVENQISNIHRKIGTKSRGELVQFASGRGIEKYTPDEWESIITTARAEFSFNTEDKTQPKK